MIPLRIAIAIWMTSALLTLCLSFSGYSIYRKIQHGRICDQRYRLEAIVQTGPEKAVLQTAYLAELLGLSSDHPISIYAVSLNRAEERLMASPLIEEAHVRRIPPSTLYVDYTARQPVARIGDFENVAMDRSGHIFPLYPFFTPKRLPVVYLGLREFVGWEEPLEGSLVDFAFTLLEKLSSPPWKDLVRIERIDLSHAHAKNLGQREIVLFLEEDLEGAEGTLSAFPKIVRLSPKEVDAQLNRLFALNQKMRDDYRSQLATAHLSGRFAPRIIDLRIPHLAFVEK